MCFLFMVASAGCIAGTGLVLFLQHLIPASVAVCAST